MSGNVLALRQPQVAADEPARVIEAPQFAGFVTRSIRAMGRRVGDHDPSSLHHFRELRAVLDQSERDAVAALHAAGFSYRDIARGLGVTHQAVIKRFGGYS